MCPSETHHPQLNSNDESKDLLITTDQESDNLITNTSTTTSTKYKLFEIILEPFQWLQMLSSELNPTFILGIFLVYGLSQGFSGSFFKVVSDYYWKDVQKVQPSAVQLFIGLYYIPWIMKPVWGLLTDCFPVRGYKRRPYFVIAGGLGTFSALMVALSGELSIGSGLVLLIGITGSVAVADVIIDACIARNSIEIRALASDMQSLCGFCSSVGALVGYSTSGFFVHHLGPQGALGLLAIPPATLIILGFIIYEEKAMDTIHLERKKAIENLKEAVKGMYKTIQFPEVWKPSLYMYLSLALSISTHEGQFYWYTHPKAGPAFSQEFVGIIYAIGAMASIVGVLLYHKILKDYPFRNLLLFAQLLYGISGMLDLVFVLRLNLLLGMPDYLFVVIEECVSRIISRIKWMPMIILSTKLCPLGIEGTFFALLMCIDSLGALTSKWCGGLVLHLFNVTRTNFENLWLTILIRNVLRFATLGLIFLVPKVDQFEVIIPQDILIIRENKFVNNDALELVPLNERLDA